MYRFSRIALLVVISCFPSLLGTHACGQTVINAPPDLISDGMVFGSDVEINIADGADVPNFFIGSSDETVSNSFVNVAGGETGNINLDAAGAHADISGGEISTLRIRNGSSATITGGNIQSLSGRGTSNGTPPSVIVSGGQLHYVTLSSDSEIIGSDFKLNGLPYTDPTVKLQSDSLRSTFTGVLADGSPFISLGGLDYTRLTEVAIAPGPSTINVSAFSDINGLGPDQTLNILAGGEVTFPFAAVDATINLDGGLVRKLGRDGPLQLARSDFNIIDGSVSPDVSIHAYDGSSLNLLGGTINTQTNIYNGATARIDGGVILEKGFDIREGGHIEIVSGSSRTVRLFDGASGRVTGGQLSRNLEAQPGSDLEIVGGEFLFNGLPVQGGTITLDEDTDMLTGTLSDGTAFIRSGYEGSNRIDLGRLTEASLPAKSTAPITIDDDSESIQGLRQGQSATLVEGGVLPLYFDVVDADFTVTGGVMGEHITLARSTMTLAGGQVDGISFTFGPGVRVLDDSVLNVTGGDRLKSLYAYNGGLINYYGSDEDGPRAMQAQAGGTVNIFGGVIGERHPSQGGGPGARENGVFNLFGTEFFIDGVPINKAPDQSVFEIIDRDVTLSGLLADGSPFELDVSAVSFRDASTVNVIVVPEPGALVLAAGFTISTLLRRRL